MKKLTIKALKSAHKRHFIRQSAGAVVYSTGATVVQAKPKEDEAHGIVIDDGIQKPSITKWINS